jgi:hypothetical protein
MIKAVTPFEEKGIEIQERAYSKEWAIKQFENSCNICCIRGIKLNCKECSIQTMHELILASIETVEANRK